MPDAADSMADRVGVAVIGYGYWGPNLARNIATGAATDLVAVCDRDPGRRERAQRNHPQARVTAEWEELLADPGVEGVAIALPIALHYRFARVALDAGKHVLVEKPLAQTVAECDDLADLAAGRDLLLMVGHTFEYNAAVQAIARYIAEGELGDPYYISMRRTNLGIVRSDANAMWNLAAHDVSIMCSWIPGEPVTVSATGAAWLQEGIEDVTFMTIHFAGDVLGHIHSSWLDPNKVREATVVGSRKMAVYDDVSPDAKIRLYDKGVDKPGDDAASLGRYEDFARFQMLARAGDVIIPKIDFHEPLAAEIEHFGRCIREHRQPLTGPANGRRVVAVLEAAQRSLRAGGGAEKVEAQRRVEALP